MTTKISKWGNSYGIHIPKKILDECNFVEGEEFELSASDLEIKIKPTKKPVKYSLQQLCDKINSKDKIEIVDWGDDIGEEIIEPYE